MDVTIFYAWQSDRPGKVNRHLIRTAAADACDRITQDQSNPWRVLLDSDTQGVAGMCDIPNTILEKIQKCDIFLADLTLVGSAAGDTSKLFPNPNVVFELGYAARLFGFEALIGVVNEAYGKVEGQVFDIKRRASLRYTAEETAGAQGRERVCEQLSKTLEEVIRTTIENVVVPRRAEAEKSQDERAAQLQIAFAEKALAGEFHGYDLVPAVLTSIQFRWPPQLTYDSTFQVIESAGVNPRPDGDTIVWPGRFSLTELSMAGHLLHAHGGDYESMKRRVAFNIKDAVASDDCRALLEQSLQRNIVHDIHQQCQLLARLGITPPWRIGVSLVGIKGFRLLAPSHEPSPRTFEGDSLYLPPVTVMTAAEVADPRSTGNTLREPLNFLCRNFGWPYNLCFSEAGEWNLR